MHTRLRWGGLRLPEDSGFLTGFIFWVAFLLVLEPDNVVRAIHAGYALSVDHELVRILGASSIGAAATPLVLHMTRSHPLQGAERWRNALWHLLTIGGLAIGLIVTSCFAAAWGFGHRLLPTFSEVLQEFVSNFTLLLFALSCLTAIAHATRAERGSSPSPASPAKAKPLRRVLVASRGIREWVAIADVDWVESQGNYVSVHVGARTHWVRQTLCALEAQLDPARFARIHRRTIVALDRISQIAAEGNGDASIRLMDGTTLRASRKYRKGLHDRWLGFGKEASKSQSTELSDTQ
jgi:hypothetical protein